MSWIDSGAFKIANRNGRRYVFRRNNSGNTEINIPQSVVTKGQAKAWLKAHPGAPKKFKPKRPGGAAPSQPSFLLKTFKLVNSPAPNFDCSLKSKLFKVVTANGRTGFKATVPTTNARLTTVTNGNLKAEKGLARIGKGRQGVVYLASTSSSRYRYVAIKVSPHDKMASARKEIQPSQAEFNNQKKIQDIGGYVARHVIQVFNLAYCLNFVEPGELNVNNAGNSSKMDPSKQAIIFMKYASGGSLSYWLDKMIRATPKRLDDKFMASIIAQIIRTLYLIHKKYPEFRHNDLHLENVFIEDTAQFGPRVMIGDFGWSRVAKNGTNPAVNSSRPGTSTANSYGVGPDTDPRYDAHLFLNELYTWVLKHRAGATDGFKKTITFLNKAVPVGYRGSKDVHVNEWRLKYQDPCKDFPSLAQIIKMKFLADVTNASQNYRIEGLNYFSPKSANLQAAKAKLRQVPKPKNRSVPKMAKAVPKPKSANLKAMKAKLRQVKKPSPRRLLSRTPSPKRTEVKKQSFKRAVIDVKNLMAAKGKLKRVKRAANIKITRNILKNPKFDKLVTRMWVNAGSKTNNFDAAWSKARNNAMRVINRRITNGLAPFTPSLPKAPPKRVSPPKALNFKLSPTSGRVKIKAPNSGRMVYANGPTISLEYLKSLAVQRGIDIKGLRSKANIARKIFT